jgi:hypothetical protein
MSLLVNYSSPSTFKLYEAAAGSSLLGPIEVPLRSVGPQIFNTISSIPFLQISGVIAEFSGINPGLNASAAPNHPLPERAAYGIVTISSVSQLGAGDGSGGVSSSPSSSVLPIRVVTVDTWQVKTAVIGQTVTIDKVEGGSASSSTYPMGIQYEGKRPTWRGTCVIALSTFANVRTLTRSSTLTVIASLGTSSYGSVMVLMAFVWVIPVLRLLLPSPQLVMIKKENDAVQLSGKEKNVHQL